MYDDRMADVYDEVYAASGKDYAAEAVALADLIRQRRPGAASLLDVACGTGEHLRHLQHLFAHVEGVELAEPMRAVAAVKVPGVTVHGGDMRTFRLSRSFDAVVCLFSAIGHLGDTDDLDTAVARMAAHLAPGGVLVVEPWFTPEQYRDGAIGHVVAERDARTVVRMSHSRRDGRRSILDMHYLVGDRDGVRSWAESHDLALFTDDEYRQAFHRAGFDTVENVTGWRSGRDRLVAIRNNAGALM